MTPAMFWRRRRRPEAREPNVGASVYRRGDRLFVLPMFDTYEAGEPAVAPMDVASAELGELVLAALARSRAESGERADIAPLLLRAAGRAASVASVGAAAVDVREQAARSRSRACAPRPAGGFEWTDDTRDVPLEDADRLGDAIRAPSAPTAAGRRPRATTTRLGVEPDEISGRSMDRARSHLGRVPRGPRAGEPA